MDHLTGPNTLFVVHNHEGLHLDYYAKVKAKVLREVHTKFHGGALPCLFLVNF